MTELTNWVYEMTQVMEIDVGAVSILETQTTSVLTKFRVRARNQVGCLSVSVLGTS